VPGFSLLHGIHRQRPDRIDRQLGLSFGCHKNLLSLFSCFEGCDLPDAAQVSLGLAVGRC
jgi:hypothetical protein